MGLYKKTEFVNGFTEAKCTNIQEIKTNVHQIIKSLSDDSTFKEFYKWIFIHCKEDEKKKTIPTDLALQLWKIVFEPRKNSYALLHSWLKFVEDSKEKDELKSISRDIWEQIVDFLQEVDDVDHYNADAAWPVAIDEFVECLKSDK